VGITTFYFKEAQGLNFAIPVEWLGELIAQSKKAEAPSEAKSPKQARAPTPPAVPPIDESSKDWAGRATALSAAEDWAGLLARSERWTNAQPKELLAWVYLASAYYMFGRYQEAVNANKEVLRLKPDFEAAWYNLGFAYGKLSRYQEALEANKEALRLKPDYAIAWYNLGVAYLGLGNRSEALKAVQELRRYDPAKAELLFNLIMDQ